LVLTEKYFESHLIFKLIDTPAYFKAIDQGLFHAFDESASDWEVNLNFKSLNN